MANKERIKIVAIKPFGRCSQFDDKLCWPHDNQEQVKNTYAKIIILLKHLKLQNIFHYLKEKFFLSFVYL